MTPGTEEAAALIAGPVLVPAPNAPRSAPAVVALALVPTKPAPIVEPIEAAESIPIVAPVRAEETKPVQAAEPIAAREPAIVEPVAAPPARVREPAERSRPVVMLTPVVAVPPLSLALPPGSPLELVETRFRSAPAPEPETARPAGPRRVRPPRIDVAEEPLQIVETTKDAPPPAS